MADPRRLIDPSLARLRADLIADQVGIWMTSRAMARTFAGAAWLVLVLAYGDAGGWLWGVPLVVSGPAAWLQATGRLRVLELPTQPRFLDGLRIVDALSVLAAATATGHLVGVLEHEDAAVAAAGAVLACAVPTLANLVAHPSYARYAGPPPFWARRRVTALAAGPLVTLLLWPASSNGAGVLIAVLGGLFLGGSGLRWAAHLDRTEAAVEDGLDDAYRAAVRELFFSLHNGLRNPARSVLNAVARETGAAEALEPALATVDPVHRDVVDRWRRADVKVRQVTWELATRISELVETTRAGQPMRPRTASDVVDAILQYHGAAKQRYHGTVVRQLDPRSLGSLDNEYVAMCLTELVTNAVVARASRLRVAVETVESAPGGTATIRVAVTCTCGRVLTDGRPSGGTLALLAEQLELINGGLFVADHGDGSHTTTARWPTDATPVELSRDQEPTDRGVTPR